MKKILLATFCVVLVMSVAAMASQKSQIVTRPLPTSEQPYWGPLLGQAQPGMSIPMPTSVPNNPPSDRPHTLQGGDNIESAFPIPSLPFTDNGTTTGYTSDWDCPCGGYPGSPDVVYSYTPASDVIVDANLCGTQFYSTLYVFENDPSNMIACDLDYYACPIPGPPSASLDLFPLTAGNTYYFVVDGYASGVEGNYTFNIMQHLAVICPEGAMLEGEPTCFDGAVDDYNGGCNSNPPIFQTILDGQTVCGTSGTYRTDEIDYRDTDWYTFNVSETRVIHWSAIAEFPFQVMILYSPNGLCGQQDVFVLGQANGSSGDSITVSANVSAGTYYLFVSPYNAQVTCGATYTAWLTTEDAPTPPANDNCADVNPISIGPGTTVFTGDNTGATSDCDQLEWVPEVWIAFTLTDTLDVTIDYCGTHPTFQSAYIVLADACPCGNLILCHSYTRNTCPDSNLSLTWTELPSGTYYFPVLSQMMGSYGAYNINITASGPAAIDVTPTEITGEAEHGNSDVHTMTISNVGLSDLQYLVIPLPDQTLRPASLSSIRTQLEGSKAFNLSSAKPVKSAAIETPIHNEISGGSHGQRRILQGGEDINSATPIDVLPFYDTGNTSGANNDYESSLCTFATGAPDLVYSFIPDRNMFITISLYGSSFDTKLYVFQNDPSNEIACNEDYYFDGTSQIDGLPVSVGNTYYVIVDGVMEGYQGDYVINVNEFIPCVVDCPQGGVPEVEQCGEDVNGGCNAHPPVFEAATVNSTICGTAWSTTELHDTDWYLISITEPTLLTLTAVGEFPLQLILIDGNPGCPAHDSQIFNGAYADPCSTASFSWTVNPGVYWVFVSPYQWYDMPCDGTGRYGNDYYVTINGIPAWLSANVTRGDIPYGAAPVDAAITLNAANLSAGTYTGTIAVLSTDLQNPEIDVPVTFTVTGGGCPYILGDINENGSPDAVDVTFGVNYLKGRNSPHIDCSTICPGHGAPFFASGDVNGSCEFNGVDITFFVNYLKGRVSNMISCPDCPPAGRIAVGGSVPVITPTAIQGNKTPAKGQE